MDRPKTGPTSSNPRASSSRKNIPLYDLNDRTQRRILDSTPRIIGNKGGAPTNIPDGYLGGDSWAANKGVPGKFHPSKLPPFLHKYMFPTSYAFTSQREAQRVANRVVMMRRWGAPLLAFGFIFFPYSIFGRDTKVLDAIDISGLALEDDGED